MNSSLNGVIWRALYRVQTPATSRERLIQVHTGHETIIFLLSSNFTVFFRKIMKRGQTALAPDKSPILNAQEKIASFQLRINSQLDAPMIRSWKEAIFL